MPASYRELRVIESAQGARVTLEGREVILLCSNDYLGLAGHPAIRRAAADAAERWGAGAGASRLVSGNMLLHRELEEELADVQGACAVPAVRLGLPRQCRGDRDARWTWRRDPVRRVEPRFDR